VWLRRRADGRSVANRRPQLVVGSRRQLRGETAETRRDRHETRRETTAAGAESQDPRSFPREIP